MSTRTAINDAALRFVADSIRHGGDTRGVARREHLTPF